MHLTFCSISRSKWIIRPGFVISFLFGRRSERPGMVGQPVGWLSSRIAAFTPIYIASSCSELRPKAGYWHALPGSILQYLLSNGDTLRTAGATQLQHSITPHSREERPKVRNKLPIQVSVCTSIESGRHGAGGRRGRLSRCSGLEHINLVLPGLRLTERAAVFDLAGVPAECRSFGPSTLSHRSRMRKQKAKPNVKCRQ